MDMRDRGLKSAQVLGGVLALLILNPGLLRLAAQQYFGTIVGTVTDPSGAAVPDASVTVTNPQTAISRQVKTDDMGNYRVESLVPGTYKLKVEHSGFETAEVQATDLPVARTVTVNVVMRIGAATGPSRTISPSTAFTTTKSFSNSSQSSRALMRFRNSRSRRM